MQPNNELLCCFPQSQFIKAPWQAPARRCARYSSGWAPGAALGAAPLPGRPAKAGCPLHVRTCYLETLSPCFPELPAESSGLRNVQVLQRSSF